MLARTRDVGLDSEETLTLGQFKLKVVKYPMACQGARSENVAQNIIVQSTALLKKQKQSKAFSTTPDRMGKLVRDNKPKFRVPSNDLIYSDGYVRVSMVISPLASIARHSTRTYNPLQANMANMNRVYLVPLMIAEWMALIQKQRCKSWTYPNNTLTPESPRLS